MGITLHVRNLRALRAVQWSPGGVCCLVGPNGSGKTTLILALKLLRAAFEHDLPLAVTTVLGGSFKLRHAAALEDEPVEIGLDVGDLSWRVQLSARGSSVEPFAAETVRQGQEPILHRSGLSASFDYRGERLTGDNRLALRFVADARPEDAALKPLIAVLKQIGVFHDPDLHGLRESGSPQVMSRQLAPRGYNVFTMLRSWNERREHRTRYEFVVAGLRAAFPDLCADIDFDAGGQTVTLNVYRPGEAVPVPIHLEANGLLSMLVHLCCIVSGEPGGIVAIDEPENALHPFAIRRLMDYARQWAKRMDLTVIFTTHSPVLLNEFRKDLQDLFVMEPGQLKLPVRVNELRDPTWLSNFELGELYANCEFGASAA